MMRNIQGNLAHQIGWKQNGSEDTADAVNRTDRDLVQKGTGKQMPDIFKGDAIE